MEFKDNNYRQRQKIILGKMDKYEKIAWTVFFTVVVLGAAALIAIY